MMSQPVAAGLLVCTQGRRACSERQSLRENELQCTPQQRQPGKASISAFPCACMAPLHLDLVPLELPIQATAQACAREAAMAWVHSLGMEKECGHGASSQAGELSGAQAGHPTIKQADTHCGPALTIAVSAGRGALRVAERGHRLVAAHGKVQTSLVASRASCGPGLVFAIPGKP